MDLERLRRRLASNCLEPFQVAERERQNDPIRPNRPGLSVSSAPFLLGVNPPLPDNGVPSAHLKLCAQLLGHPDEGNREVRR